MQSISDDNVNDGDDNNKCEGEVVGVEEHCAR